MKITHHKREDGIMNIRRIGSVARRIITVLIILAIGIGLVSCTLSTGTPDRSASDSESSLGTSSQTKEETEQSSNADNQTSFASGIKADVLDKADASFSETMLNVGQGLSILIKADGQNMIYDGGGRDFSSYVVAYLQKHNVTHLKYMFVSHYDEDHIAGLVGVLHTADVDTIVCPDYKADSKIYDSFAKAVQAGKSRIVHPFVGDTFSLGKATITVLGPDDYQDERENNRSIASKITYGSFSSVITGDAEYEEEDRILQTGMDVNTDLYVAGHHGSSNSSSDAFVRAMSPADAFISCGTGNSYGHPHKETLAIQKNAGCDIFRSDIQGEVTCFSDGTHFWFSSKPCNDWTPGSYSHTDTKERTSTESNNTSDKADEEGTEFVVNISSKKFHRPDCTAVEKIKEKNKQVISATRQKLIDEGYSPCGICNP